MAARGLEQRIRLAVSEFRVAAFGPLGEAEFYVEDMVGCEAFQPDGQRRGRVTGTFWNGAQDVMTIVGDDGGERLVPVVPEYVLHFESASRRLTIDPHA